MHSVALLLLFASSVSALCRADLEFPKSLNKCDILSKIKRSIHKEGFHRELEYLIEVTYLENWQDCVLCVEETIPTGFYINPDELRIVSQTRGVWAKINSTVDIEQPASHAKPHTILLFSSFIKQRVDQETQPRLFSKIAIPIHVRYHEAVAGGGSRRALLQRERVWLYCPSHPCPGFDYSLPCPVEDSTCLYKAVPNLIKSETWVDVPVGNLDHYSLVVTITFLVTAIGSIFLLFALGTSFRRPVGKLD